MSNLRYQVGLDTSQAQRSLTEFNTRVGALENGLNALGANGSLGKLGASLAALGGAAGFGALIGRGVKFNQVIGDSEVAISNVLAQFQGLNAEAAKGAAAKAMQQLIALEPQAAGSLQDLTSGFLATLAASQQAGLSVEQNIDLVGKFANALANANLPAEQLAQEMRSILTANIGADSTLAKILGISNEDVKRAADAGQLYNFLVEKIGKLGEAGDTAAVAFSTLQSAVDKAAGALAAGIFEDAVVGAKQLADQLNRNEQTFKALGQGLGLISSALLSLTERLTKAAQVWGAFSGAIGAAVNLDLSWSEAFNQAALAFEEAINGADQSWRDFRTNAAQNASGLAQGLDTATKSATDLKKAIESIPGAQDSPTSPTAPSAPAAAVPSANLIAGDTAIQDAIDRQIGFILLNRSPRGSFGSVADAVSPEGVSARVRGVLDAAPAVPASASPTAGGLGNAALLLTEMQNVVAELQKLNAQVQ